MDVGKGRVAPTGAAAHDEARALPEKLTDAGGEEKRDHVQSGEEEDAKVEEHGKFAASTASTAGSSATAAVGSLSMCRLRRGLA